MVRVPDDEIVPSRVSGSTDPDVALDLTVGSTAPAVFRVAGVGARDVHLVPAWTRGHESVRDALLDGGAASRVVAGPEATPGPSEYSFGRGGMPPLTLADPSLAAQLSAVYRTDPADPGSVVDYTDRVGE